ncbi:TerB family tellurite resistance protein [Thaumasiovibrio subtropicus]|uniref:tellurite resistance TerB family protein n=1 Tax=Thaumasiovibrio subtropicus TaxID=1891207 RepID=UPI000B361369|nr:TerB family tellurite resistance protein [Thaumasiovibrio subtropicus]
MFKQLKVLFRQLTAEGGEGGIIDTPALNLAMAGLLCEVSRADSSLDPREHAAKRHLLSSLLDVEGEEADRLLEKATKASDEAVSLYDFTSKLRSLEAHERISLIEAMWQVAYADGEIDPLEEAVIRQVSELIYVEHTEFIRAKLSAQQAASS